MQTFFNQTLGVLLLLASSQVLAQTSDGVDNSFKAKTVGTPADVQRPDGNNIAQAGIQGGFPGSGQGAQGVTNPSRTASPPASVLFPGRRLAQMPLGTSAGYGSSDNQRVSIDIDDASRQVIASNRAASALAQRTAAPQPDVNAAAAPQDAASPLIQPQGGARPSASSVGTSGAAGRKLHQLISTGTARVTVPENVATIDLSSEDLQRVRSSSVASSQQAERPLGATGSGRGMERGPAGGAAGRKLQQAAKTGSATATGTSGGHAHVECIGSSNPYENCGLVPNVPSRQEQKPTEGSSIGIGGRKMLQEMEPSLAMEHLLTSLLPQARPSGTVQLSTSSDPKYDLSGSSVSTAGEAAAPSPR